MTEAEWFACTDPEKLLAFEKQRPSGSMRKQRLFACACSRHVSDFMDARCLEAIEVAERYEDDLVDGDDLVLAFQETHEISEELRKEDDHRFERAADLANVACEESSEMAYCAYLYLLDMTPEAGSAVSRVWADRVIKCVWGVLPFRPISIDRAWLEWNGGIVRRLAAETYEKRCLPEGTLDPGTLGVLSDALEEGGCTDADLLSHLRSPGPHVRGCWPLDLLLGKE
jgi:hypothetical protein